MSVPPPDRLSVPLCTSTVPVLLNSAEIVEVDALPDLMKAPALFTAAVVPLSLAFRLKVRMLRPLLVVWSVNVAPLAMVRVPEPASLTPVFQLAAFRLIRTTVPVTVLAPPSCSVWPPSSPKFVKLNAAPPVANVVPDPLCVPPENDDAPVAVSVPDPFSWPALWVRFPADACPFATRVPAFSEINPSMFALFEIVNVPPERESVEPATLFN